MFSRVLALLAVLLLSANTWAAIEINNHQARNMDDVQSLGVIYINHNFATESEARQALNEETDAQGATYYHWCRRSDALASPRGDDGRCYQR